MNFDLLLNNLNDHFSVFKCESDVKTWLNKNNLSLNFLNKNDIINKGNFYIQSEIEKKLKEIKIELILDGINTNITYQNSANLETKELLGGGAIGLLTTTTLAAFFSVAFFPAVLIGGAATMLLGNYSVRQKTFQALINNSTEAAKNIAEQLSPVIKEHLAKQQKQKTYLAKTTTEKANTPQPSANAKKAATDLQLTKEQEAIKDFLEKRNITHLVHFTSTQNIDSIKKHGLLSVQELNKRNIAFHSNDTSRYDNALDYISLSVTHPNDYVLKNYIETGRIDDVSLIYIDASILYKEISTHRIYCDRNAAKSSCEKGSTLYCLQNMFGNNKEYDRTFKNPNETTDRQAEILFNKKVDKKYFKNIVKWG